VALAAAGILLISLDSGSISAGMVQRAPRGYSGATMAIFSMAGFGAGLIGPFIFGAVLQLIGGTAKMGWVLAFATIGLLTFVAPLSMKLIGIKDDPGT